MLFLCFDEVLVSRMDVLVGLVDVLLGNVQLGALLVDEALHILLHLQRIDHPALDFLDLLLLDLDHALVVQRLLVHLVHADLGEAALAVLLVMLHPRLADLLVCVAGRVRMLESVARRVVTRLVSTISCSLSYS